jgi:hypothetical protein
MKLGDFISVALTLQKLVRDKAEATDPGAKKQDLRYGSSNRRETGADPVFKK